MTNPTKAEEMREKIDAWVAQAYTNGSLDIYAPANETQGYEVCTDLIMEIVTSALEAQDVESRFKTIQSLVKAGAISDRSAALALSLQSHPTQKDEHGKPN